MRIPFKKGVKGVYTIVNIDGRRDRKVSPGDKIKSVRRR
ncbi:MAG: thiamine-binding protein [Syntrophales bacterium]|nr:thiamine-binding protein [Syntrophales bacterium]